ncbi:phage protein Gp37 [Candidatus Symbiopectobacterium sp. 'North America']|uniref:phage protein Gp37 n=1 Tax=Candidatus Symbiopectobacterium sp. 'North America' TaxID=2794574 RepID=UPI001FD3FD23|nr:phage protein Gp37 [Candidatus Symbiopectobacterium sp. 'North America']
MIIRDIENAMIARLKKGKGSMAANVCSYGGELDGEPGEVARALPAIWVTFGGIQNTKNANIGKRKYEVVGRFVMIVGEYSVRSEEASQHGGANFHKVGTYRMVGAVRRLLSGQDLAEFGLKVDFLMPGRVRSLFNTHLEHQALSVFACEFDTKWFETALENGKYPFDGPSAFHPDSILTAIAVKPAPMIRPG